MNYNENVSTFRDLAREEIRLQMTNRRRDIVLSFDNRIKDGKDWLAKFEKDIARTTYRLSKLEEANPDYVELKANEEKKIEDNKKAIEQTNKSIEDLEKEKNAVVDEITKIQSGDMKVNAEELTEKTKALIEAHVRGLAVKAEVKE